jgi:hypothetical protein
MLLLLFLESLGYQYQGGIKHPQQHFSLSLLGDTQMLLNIIQEVKASTKRGLNLLSHGRHYSYDLERL